MLETMDANTLAPRQTAVHGRLRIFSLYVDFPGSVRARWANCTLSQLAGENWVTSTEMWRLDSASTSIAIRNMIAGEAARADILLVTISNLNYRQHELVAWLESVAICPTDRQSPGLFIGLFGEDDHQSGELKWTVDQCRNCSLSMNRDFIWHCMETAAPTDDSWLKVNLDTFLSLKLKLLEKALCAALPLRSEAVPA